MVDGGLVQGVGQVTLQVNYMTTVLIVFQV